MLGNGNLVEEFEIKYKEKIWNIKFFSKGIEVNNIKKRVIIYSEKEEIPYGQTRNFLKKYCKWKYGKEIPSNKKLNTYELVRGIKTDYEFCKLIYKYRKKIK